MVLVVLLQSFVEIARYLRSRAFCLLVLDVWELVQRAAHCEEPFHCFHEQRVAMVVFSVEGKGIHFRFALEKKGVSIVKEEISIQFS